MTKQQEYFEKNVIPYRQKIRELESENNQLHVDKAVLCMQIEGLECENEKLMNEIKSIMEFANMTPGDRRNALTRTEIFSNLNSFVSSVSRLY